MGWAVVCALIDRECAPIGPAAEVKPDLQVKARQWKVKERQGS